MRYCTKNVFKDYRIKIIRKRFRGALLCEKKRLSVFGELWGNILYRLSITGQFSLRAGCLINSSHQIIYPECNNFNWRLKFYIVIEQNLNYYSMPCMVTFSSNHFSCMLGDWWWRNYDLCFELICQNSFINYNKQKKKQFNSVNNVELWKHIFEPHKKFNVQYYNDYVVVQTTQNTHYSPKPILLSQYAKTNKF